MKSLILTTVSALVFSAFYIETDKTEKLKDNSIVKYHLDDKGKKNGPISITDPKGTILLSGSFKNSVRTNDWYCFDKDGTVILRYNYTLKKLISLSDKQIVGLKFRTIDKDEEVIKEAQVPVPICGVEQFKALFIAEFYNQIPPKQKATKANLKGEVTAMINEKGSVKYFVKYVLEGYEYKTNVDPDTKAFAIEWIPSTYKDKSYKSEVTFDIDLSIEPSTERRFIWNY